MATITQAGSAVWNTTAGNHAMTFTPAVGDVIVAVAPSTAVATISVADNNSGGAGTYTQVDADRTGWSSNSDGHLTMYVRDSPIKSAVSTVITATQTGSSGGGIAVYRISGMTRSGSIAVRSNGGQSSGTASTTPAPVLNQTPLSTNPIIIALCNSTNGTANMTARAGYTERHDLGYTSPQAGFAVCTLDSGETSATLTLGGTTPSTFGSAAIELDASAIPGPTLVQIVEVANWNSATSPRSVSVTGALTGDRFTVLAVGCQDTGAGHDVTAVTTSTTSGSTSAWTEIAEDLTGTTDTWISCATATVSADGTIGVQVAKTGGTLTWGFYLVHTRGDGGIGNNSGVTAFGSAQVASLNVSTSNSIVAFVSGDFIVGGVRTAWVPQDGAQFVEASATTDFTVAAAYWQAQASGTRNYGASGGGGGANYRCFAVEIKPAGAATASSVPYQAVRRRLPLLVR